MPRTASIRDIETLRTLRTRAPKDLSVVSEVASLARQIRSVSNRASTAEEQWGRVIPPALHDSFRNVRVSRGVLTVSAQSAAAAAAIKKWLASGGEVQVRASISGVRAIKVSTR